MVLSLHRNRDLSRNVLTATLFLSCIISQTTPFDLTCLVNIENSTCIVFDLKITQKGEKIDNVITQNKKIDELFISDKVAKYLPSNLGEKFVDLINLKLQRSKLIEISIDDFKGMQSLKNLDLWNNELTKIVKNTFNDLQLLEELNLNDNKLNVIDAKAFSKLKNLKVINLGSNHLEEIDVNLFRHNKELTVVSLEDNFLKELPNLLFANLKLLKQLKLNNNEIKSLQDQLFRSNELLEDLNVADNSITSVGSENEMRIRNLVEQSFLYNPCTETLAVGYTKDVLMKVLSEHCRADNSTKIQWLRGELREMGRFKREDDNKLKCLEDELISKNDKLKESNELLNGFCEDLKAEIVTAKGTSRTEVDTIPTQVQNTLTQEYSKIIAIEERIKSEISNINDQIAKSNAALQPMFGEIKKITTQIENTTQVFKENFDKLSDENAILQKKFGEIDKFQVHIDRIIAKEFKEISSKLNNETANLQTKLGEIDNIPAHVKSTLTQEFDKFSNQLKESSNVLHETMRGQMSEILDHLKNENVALKEALTAAYKEFQACDFYKLSYEFVQHAMKQLPNDKHNDFFNLLDDINQAVEHKRLEITASFEEVFDDANNEKVVEFKKNLKDLCSLSIN